MKLHLTTSLQSYLGAFILQALPSFKGKLGSIKTLNTLHFPNRNFPVNHRQVSASWSFLCVSLLRKSSLKGPFYKNKQGDLISYFKIRNALLMGSLIIYFGLITKIWRNAQELRVHNRYHSTKLLHIKHRLRSLLLSIFCPEYVLQLFGNIWCAISVLALKEGN